MDSSHWTKWWHFQIHSAIFKVRGGEEFPLRGCGRGRRAAPWKPFAWNFQMRLTLWYNLCRWTQFDLLWTLRRTFPAIRYLRHLMPLLRKVIEKVKNSISNQFLLQGCHLHFDFLRCLAKKVTRQVIEVFSWCGPAAVSIHCRRWRPSPASTRRYSVSVAWTRYIFHHSQP